jgi:hypothetical protein
MLKGVVLGVAITLAVALIGAYVLARSGLIPANADRRTRRPRNLDGRNVAGCDTSPRSPNSKGKPCEHKRMAKPNVTAQVAHVAERLMQAHDFEVPCQSHRFASSQRRTALK